MFNNFDSFSNNGMYSHHNFNTDHAHILADLQNISLEAPTNKLQNSLDHLKKMQKELLYIRHLFEVHLGEQIVKSDLRLRSVERKTVTTNALLQAKIQQITTQLSIIDITQQNQFVSPSFINQEQELITALYNANRENGMNHREAMDNADLQIHLNKNSSAYQKSDLSNWKTYDEREANYMNFAMQQSDPLLLNYLLNRQFIGGYARARLRQLENMKDKNSYIYCNLKLLIDDPNIKYWSIPASNENLTAKQIKTLYTEFYKNMPFDLQEKYAEQEYGNYNMYEYDTNYLTILKNFWRQIKNTKDWKCNTETIHNLFRNRFKAIIDYLDNIKNQLSAKSFFKQCLEDIIDAQIACPDRTIVGLETIELNIAYHKSQYDLRALFSIAMVRFKKRQIENFTKLIDNNDQEVSEPLEAVLFYICHLNRLFELNSQIQDMTYSALVNEKTCEYTLVEAIEKLFETFEPQQIVNYIASLEMMEPILKPIYEADITYQQYKTAIEEADNNDTDYINAAYHRMKALAIQASKSFIQQKLQEFSYLLTTTSTDYDLPQKVLDIVAML